MLNTNQAVSALPAMQVPPPVIHVSVRRPKSDRYVDPICTEEVVELARTIVKPTDFAQHNVYAILVGGDNAVYGHYHLARGDQNWAVLDVGLLLSIALRLRAAKIVLIHTLPNDFPLGGERIAQELPYLISACSRISAQLGDYIMLTQSEHESCRFSNWSDTAEIFKERSNYIFPRYVID